MLAVMLFVLDGGNVTIVDPFSVHDQLVAEKGAGELVAVKCATRPGTNCRKSDEMVTTGNWFTLRRAGAAVVEPHGPPLIVTRYRLLFINCVTAVKVSVAEVAPAIVVQVRPLFTLTSHE
jgi:hypothetical protein